MTLYRAYMLYNLIIATHGLYVALGYLRWVGGYSYGCLIWLFSWVYEYKVPRPLEQLADKDHTKQINYLKTFPPEGTTDFTLLDPDGDVS